jgi:hypothetical protein
MVIAGCAVLLAQQGDTILASVRQLSATQVVLSGAVAVPATMCLQQAWRSLLTGFGVAADRRDAAAAFYVSQLGKYLPGAVWPVVVQVELGARWSVPRRVMLTVGLQLILVVTTSGILIGSLLLPWSSPSGISRYAWLLALVPLALVALHPRLLSSVLDTLSVKTGGHALGARASVSGLLRASWWAALMWLLLGVHLAILMAAFTTIGPLEAAAAVGGMGLAWAAGIAFLPAPAGAGVREAVLMLTLSPFIGREAALAIAITSRALLVLVDVVLAAIAAGRSTARGFRTARARTSAPDTGDSE